MAEHIEIIALVYTGFKAFNQFGFSKIICCIFYDILYGLAEGLCAVVVCSDLI